MKNKVYYFPESTYVGVLALTSKIMGYRYQSKKSNRQKVQKLGNKKGQNQSPNQKVLSHKAMTLIGR